MEDAQVPGAEMIKEYWPNDSNGWLFKNHVWFEGDYVQNADGSMNFNGESGCLLGRFTSTVNGVANQYKLARYRWMWWIRQFPDSANDFKEVFALIDAANTPTSNPGYYARMESQVDTEEWMRMTAIEHATGDWDSFLSQDSWNMYSYKPTMGKWTVLKWDWNISLGSSGSWGPDGSQLFTLGPGDSVKAAFFNYPPYLRAYLRAFQDIANLAVNNAAVNPVLDAKYAAFVANGLTANSAYGLQVQEPGAAGLKNWIGTMHNSLVNAIASRGAANIQFRVNPPTLNGNLAVITGTAPLAVKTLSFNGVEWPVTWISISSWRVSVPLDPGTNQLSIVGVDLRGQPVSGSSNSVSVIYSGSAPSPAGHVVINEIMYQPTVPGAEYIELYNNSSATGFDLSGWQLPALNYTFPSGSLLNANNFLVLAANPSSFASAYGGTIPIFDFFTGTLSGTGQNLFLEAPSTNSAGSTVIAGVAYRATPPWPAGANGNGSSLQLVDPTQDNWRVGNWVGNFPPKSLSPGSANSGLRSLPVFPSLWLNELQADNLSGITNSAGEHTAWLELYNPTTNVVALVGLYLSNDYANLTGWAFPGDAVVNPGEFKVIFADGETNLSTSAELHTSFTLTSGAGSLALTRLFNGSPEVLDYMDYTNLAPDHSYGSVPDGQSFVRQALAFATPGSSNNLAGLRSFIPYSSPGSVYTQNFDSLPNPGAISVNSANPVVINGTTYALANPFAFDAQPSASANSGGGLGIAELTGWYGWAGLDAKFGASYGDQTTGGQISFGLPGDPNRALGLLATSSTGATAMGAKFINATAQILNHINVQITGELWRQSNLAKTLQCYYAIDPTGAGSFPTNLTAYLPELNVSLPPDPSAVGGLPADSTLSQNRANLSIVNQAITNWPPGGAFWLVWQMNDAAGKAQGLAIDDLSVSAFGPAAPTPVPVSFLLTDAGLVLTWPGSANQTYQLEFKDDLGTGSWLSLGAPLIGTGNSLSVTNAITLSTQRFYRLRIF
jgi:hypothetical protein